MNKEIVQSLKNEVTDVAEKELWWHYNSQPLLKQIVEANI
jgi:hypothetical protein